MKKAPRTTERCELVPLARDHLDALHRIVTDGHVKEFLLDGQSVGLDFCAAEQRSSDASFERDGVGLWLVRLRGRSEWCGFAGFRVFEGLPPDPGLVYALLPEYTGSGLATEISSDLVAVARSAGLRSVNATVDLPNVASRRVLEKVGFQLAGHVPGAFGEMALFEHAPRAVQAERRRLSALPPSMLSVAHFWNGPPATPAAELRLSFQSAELVVDVNAPWHGDPAPRSPVGASPRLWEHEVVELFLAGQGDRYLEVELSPHGHHLVLSLEGERRVMWGEVPLLYRAQIQGQRWTGRARIPMSWLPRGLSSLNAHAIAGTGGERRYWSFRPCSGAVPDFHRLEKFAPLSEVFGESEG